MTNATKEIQAKSFDTTCTTKPIGDIARVDTVYLGEITANRAIMQPGFRWTEHIKPKAGTDLCQVRHTGYVVSGRIGIRMADGTEGEVSEGYAFDVLPGHDMWVIGDEPYVSVDFSLTESPSVPLR
ncbi:MAG: cupin domain-containing protein [Chloroflexota bacterium]